MLFHRCQDAEVALHAPRVVIADVTLYRLDQIFLAGKALAIVALSFEDAPEALHWAVVDAMGHTRHALRHLCLLELVMKFSVRVLKAPVAVEQRMGVGVGLDRLVEGFEHQRIVITLAYDIGNDAAITEIKNGAEINLVYFYTFVPLEFCHIREPFLIGFICIELPVKQILCDVLRILSLPRAVVAAVFDSGFDAHGTADSQDTFVVHMNTVVVPQFVIDAPVAFIRAVHVNLFDLLGKSCVLGSSGT